MLPSEVPEVTEEEVEESESDDDSSGSGGDDAGLKYRKNKYTGRIPF